MSDARHRSEKDEERRRGWLLMFLFFGLLLVGCALYYAWLTLRGDETGAVRAAAPPPTAPVERVESDATLEPTQLASDLERAGLDQSGAGAPPEGRPQAAPITLEPVPEPTADPVAAPVSEPAPPPAFEGPVPIFEDSRWLQTASIRGVDRAGRGAAFTVHVLSGANAWTFGRSDQMDVAGQVVPAAEIFDRKGLGEGYCGQDALIAIGAASFEGERDLNDRLAGARARRLVNSLGDAAPACARAPARYMANLGEHTRSMVCPGDAERCPEMSAFQRPIVIVAGKGDSAGVEYGEALRNAIEAHEAAGRQIFPRFQLGDYSRFDVSR